MSTENLLRATRNIYLLVPKPGISASEKASYWTTRLDGLSDQHIKNAVTSLRQDLEKKTGPGR